VHNCGIIAMAGDQRHQATIALVDPVPAEVPVGAGFAVKAVVSCADGCDPQSLVLNIAAPGGTETLCRVSPGAEETWFEIALCAPTQVGEHGWRISLPSQPADDVDHDAEPVSIKVRVIPQTTSLAVWDIPAPVVIGQVFEIKAGAKSSGEFKLSGRLIEICDEAGCVLAQGRLGDSPWPGTSGLYWTPLRVLAPAKEGLCKWFVRFGAADVELPHDGSTSNFTVAIARPAEHRLTVVVSEKDTGNPIAEAEVRFGAYRGTTDPGGIAVLAVPKGSNELVVWKVGYDIPVMPTAVEADLVVRAEAIIVPEEDPDAIWQT
jgi:hypothetical protein